MGIKLETVIAAIAEAQELTPAFIELINEIKTVIGTDDAAVIEEAVESSSARADAQHKSAQDM